MPVYTVSEYKVGTETGGIRLCVVCRQEIKEQDQWIKQWAFDGSYAVGVHARCLLANGPTMVGLPGSAQGLVYGVAAEHV